MKIAFVIYRGMTALDFIGIYDPLIRLKTMGIVEDLQWEICAYTPIVEDSAGLRLMPTEVAHPLNAYDMIIVPGGKGCRELIDDKGFIEWLKTAQDCKTKVSVCTGALLLGAAGFLKGKAATTHPNAFGALEKYCKSVVKRRIVDEGDVITAGGVTSAIDLGLYLCEKLAGKEARIKIAKQIDYNPDTCPPP